MKILSRRVFSENSTLVSPCKTLFVTTRARPDYLVSEFVDYYKKHRAHCSQEYLPPCSTDPPPEYKSIKLDEIDCEEHLGGLIKSYERIAA